MLNRFIEEGGDTGDNARHLSVIAELRRFLELLTEGASRTTEALQVAGVPVEIKVQRQPNRFYGHSLVDLIALSSINVLAGVEISGSSRPRPRCYVTNPRLSTYRSRTPDHVRACGA